MRHFIAWKLIPVVLILTSCGTPRKRSPRQVDRTSHKAVVEAYAEFLKSADGDGVWSLFTQELQGRIQGGAAGKAEMVRDLGAKNVRVGSHSEFPDGRVWYFVLFESSADVPFVTRVILVEREGLWFIDDYESGDE